MSDAVDMIQRATNRFAQNDADVAERCLYWLGVWVSKNPGVEFTRGLIWFFLRRSIAAKRRDDEKYSRLALPLDDYEGYVYQRDIAHLVEVREMLRSVIDFVDDATAQEIMVVLND